MIVEASARRAAMGPGPSHFAHIDANEMLSDPSRFGPVVSVTVRYHSCNRIRLPFQPYDAAGSSSPAAITSPNTNSGRQPIVHASHGSRTSPYGLTNTAAATAAPAVSPRSCRAAITAVRRRSATGRLNCPNASSLTRNLPLKSSTSQKSTRTEILRSGRAAIESRTSPHAINTVSVNQVTSAARLGTSVNGTITAANVGKYLY